MPSQARPGRVKRLLGRAALVGLALAAALAIAEGALRLRGGFTPDPPLWPGERESGAIAADLGVVDPELGWRLGPHQRIEARHPDHAGVVYAANGQGFRSSLELDRDAAPAAGSTRVAFVGDSFTFGMGVALEDTFAERVAAALPGARALNLGQAGFGVDQMERTLALWALALRPALVVVTFVDDDLARSLSAYRMRGGWIAKPTFVLDSGELRPMTAADRPGALARWAARELRLVEAWRRVEARLSRRFGLGYTWRLNRALFARMRDACAGAGVPLVVVRLPQRGSWVAAPAWVRDLEALGIPTLDLGKRRPADPRALYFRRDVHLNAQGHRYVAEQLAEFLGRAGLP